MPPQIVPSFNQGRFQSLGAEGEDLEGLVGGFPEAGRHPAGCVRGRLALQGARCFGPPGAVRFSRCRRHQDPVFKTPPLFDSADAGLHRLSRDELVSRGAAVK